MGFWKTLKMGHFWCRISQLFENFHFLTLFLLSFQFTKNLKYQFNDQKKSILPALGESPGFQTGVTSYFEFVSFIWWDLPFLSNKPGLCLSSLRLTYIFEVLCLVWKQRRNGVTVKLNAYKCNLMRGRFCRWIQTAAGRQNARGQHGFLNGSYGEYVRKYVQALKRLVQTYV